MLDVMESADVTELIRNCFSMDPKIERIPLEEAPGRVLAEDIVSEEFVPDFDRSTVDGYAVASREVFGCSDSIPALLKLLGEVSAGEEPEQEWELGGCFYVPTGGALPKGTDAMVMIEYAETFSDGTVAVYKASAPGQHVVFRGDDIKAGEAVRARGVVLTASDVGSLSAIGVTRVPVFVRPVVGILSTGDELVPPGQTPAIGQMRDVNGPMLQAAVKVAGGISAFYGIVRDDYDALFGNVQKAISECDMLLISGGTSVGSKDATERVIEAQGEVLVHGIAIKPGKPTIVGRIGPKPIFGLPGHPLAAYFMYSLFVRSLIESMGGYARPVQTVEAKLTRAISSNEGREECVPVRWDAQNLTAMPLIGKSGLIATLLEANGYIRIKRDCEGLAKGAKVAVILFGSDEYGV